MREGLASMSNELFSVAPLCPTFAVFGAYNSLKTRELRLNITVMAMIFTILNLLCFNIIMLLKCVEGLFCSR